MYAFTLNLLLAIIWCLLQAEISVVQLTLGYLLGLAVISFFPGLFGGRDYVRRLRALAFFFLVFAREFAESSLHLLRTCLFTRMSTLQPRIITYNIAGLSKAEVLLLSHCISLTPGTTTIDVSQDFSELLLHVLDSADANAVRNHIDGTLKRGILAFTR